MASLGMGLGVVASSRAFKTNATGRNSGGGVEEKGPVDWLIGVLQKQDQLFETDPILSKVEDKSSRGGTTSVSVPSNGKKNFPGLGGLFAKN